MFSRLALPTFILSAVLVALADPTPTEPGPGNVYNEGSTCNIEWTPDSTGLWKTLNIELMTGDNLNMVHLTTVATVDGTVSPGTFNYTCPDVTINSAIYFYQFTSPASSDRTWTGRFAIASSTGATVPPPNATQPDGEAIPWGLGALSNPSSAVAAPSYLTGGNNTGTSTTSASSTPLAVVPSSFVTVTTSTLSTPSTKLGATSSPTLLTGTSSGTSSGSPASSTSGTSTPSTSTNSAGGLIVGAVSTHAAQAGVALAVIAASFTFLF